MIKYLSMWSPKASDKTTKTTQNDIEGNKFVNRLNVLLYRSFKSRERRLYNPLQICQELKMIST